MRQSPSKADTIVVSWRPFPLAVVEIVHPLEQTMPHEVEEIDEIVGSGLHVCILPCRDRRWATDTLPALSGSLDAEVIFQRCQPRR